MMVTSAIMELRSGDGQVFWREYEQGGLVDEEEVKAWIAGRVQKMIDGEERYTLYDTDVN